jgi:hypothetical protein
MGVGQRLTRNAAHVGGVIVLSNSRVINEVLIPIYELLDIPLVPEATGSVADAYEVDASLFMDRLTDRVISDRPSTMETMPEAVRSQAMEFRPDHDPRASRVA